MELRHHLAENNVHAPPHEHAVPQPIRRTNGCSTTLRTDAICTRRTPQHTARTSHAARPRSRYGTSYAMPPWDKHTPGPPSWPWIALLRCPNAYVVYLFVHTARTVRLDRHARPRQRAPVLLTPSYRSNELELAAPVMASRDEGVYPQHYVCENRVYVCMCVLRVSYQLDLLPAPDRPGFVPHASCSCPTLASPKSRGHKAQRRRKPCWRRGLDSVLQPSVMVVHNRVHARIIRSSIHNDLRVEPGY